MSLCDQRMKLKAGYANGLSKRRHCRTRRSIPRRNVRTLRVNSALWLEVAVIEPRAAGSASARLPARTVTSTERKSGAMPAHERLAQLAPLRIETSARAGDGMQLRLFAAQQQFEPAVQPFGLARPRCSPRRKRSRSPDLRSARPAPRSEPRSSMIAASVNTMISPVRARKAGVEPGGLAGARRQRDASRPRCASDAPARARACRPCSRRRSPGSAICRLRIVELEQVAHLRFDAPRLVVHRQDHGDGRAVRRDARSARRARPGD